MKAITIVDSYPPLQDKDLEQFEQALRERLPDDYRAFLLQHNGGGPEDRYMIAVDAPPPCTEAAVAWFFGLSVRGRRNVHDLRDNMETYDERVPSNLLPIAVDPGGNLFCLAYKGRDKGEVYFWDHEGESDDIPTYDNVYFLARSFADFIDSLELEDDMNDDLEASE